MHVGLRQLPPHAQLLRGTEGDGILHDGREDQIGGNRVVTDRIGAPSITGTHLQPAVHIILRTEISHPLVAPVHGKCN